MTAVPVKFDRTRRVAVELDAVGSQRRFSLSEPALSNSVAALDYQYRHKLTLDASFLSAALYDYPLVVVLLSSEVNLSLMASDGSDVAFSQEQTPARLLSFERVVHSVSDRAVYVVRVPVILPIATNELYVFFGDSTITDGHDPDSVWPNCEVVHHFLNRDVVTRFCAGTTQSGQSAAGVDLGAHLEAIAGVAFGPVDCTGIVKSDASILLELKANQPDFLGSFAQFELTSKGERNNAEEWSLANPVAGIGLLREFKTFEFSLAAWLDGSSSGIQGLFAIDWFSWYNMSVENCRTGFFWRNLRIRFDPGSGYNTLADSLKNQRDLIKTSASHPETQAGHYYKRAVFAGAASDHSFQMAAALDIGLSDFTIEAWIQLNASALEFYLVGFPVHDDNDFYIKIDPVTSKVKIGWLGVEVFAPVDTQLSVVGSQIYIAVVRSKSYNNWKVYVNSTEHTIGGEGNAQSEIIFTAPLFVGSDGVAGSGAKFDGYLSDFRIHEVARSKDWLRMAYENGRGTDANVTGEVIDIAAQESGAAVTKPRGLAIELENSPGTLYFLPQN